MKRKYKLIKKRMTRLITEIEKENNISIRKTIIPVASIGIVTILGSSILLGSMSNHNDNKEIILNEIPTIEINVADFYNQNDVEKESLIDFENLDSASLDTFCDSATSLYNAPDAIDYRTQYEELVYQKAQKWGIDPNLAMAILTQESRSGKESNLMQMDFKTWEDSFRVYDFDNNKYVDILLTNDPVKYNDDRYLTINEKDLDNPVTNISIGCAMIQYNMNKMNYQIPAGIQCYNFGMTKMNDVVLDRATNETHNYRDDILSDPYNFEFMNHTLINFYDKDGKLCEYGDKEYFYHVSRFLNPEKDTVTVIEHTNDNQNIEHKFNYKKLINDYEQYKDEYLNQTL